MPEPVTALSAPAVECSAVKIAPAETVQDTKSAVQPQTTNTVDVGEMQKTETAIHRLHQATTGTQTEKKIAYRTQRH